MVNRDLELKKGLEIFWARQDKLANANFDFSQIHGPGCIKKDTFAILYKMNKNKALHPLIFVQNREWAENRKIGIAIRVKLCYIVDTADKHGNNLKGAFTYERSQNQSPPPLYYLCCR